MKLRTFFFVVFLTLVALAGLNLVLGFLLSQTEAQMALSERRKEQIAALSDDLVISSQWATRFARGYIATKDPKRFAFYNDVENILEGRTARPPGYDVEYWDLVTAGLLPPPESKKEGATPLVDQFLKLDITIDEFNQLRKAKELFLKLSVIEKTAMHAVVGEYDDGAGMFAKKGKPDPALAERLLYADSYTRLNGELSEAVHVFKAMVKERYSRLMKEEETRLDTLTGYNTYLASLLFFLVAAAALFLKFKFHNRASRLMKAVDGISSGNFAVDLDLSGQDEIAELAGAIGSMAHNLETAFQRLEEKVNLSEKALTELDNERMRSEKLLHNILPATIAQRLRGGEEVIAEVFPEVTVFFSDIVGFTNLSSKLGPHETVHLLNALFDKFDELVEKHGIEKIKTIGDSYMVVGGVPNRDPLHCQHVAEFALDVRGFIEEFSKAYPYPIEMRMGIHTGTVAAGVLGRKKFSYDLWGDVVNMASRFESTSRPNMIHVSEAVFVRLSDDFTFLDGGTVELKGKGVVSSHFLLNRKDDAPKVVEFRKNAINEAKL
jgi:adenylate cyclase